MLGPADQHRSGRFERGAHPVGPRRPFRPARPRRHVALPRAAQRLLVAVDGQDATRAVGDGHDAAEVLDLARDRRRGTAELGEDDLVLERVLGGRLVLRGRDGGLPQTRVDVVLLATSIPRGGHLGPDPPHAVVASKKALTRCGYRLVPLRVAPAMTPRGLAHTSLRTNGRWPRQGAASDPGPAPDARSPRPTAIRRGLLQGLHGAGPPGPLFVDGRPEP